MFSKTFQTLAEATQFATNDIDVKEFIYEIRQDNLTKEYIVVWVEKKSYIAQDGKSYPDEVWVTANGEMKCIQDIEPDHARNIIRMIIREERERYAMIKQALEELSSEYESQLSDSTVDNRSTGPTLH